MPSFSDNINKWMLYKRVGFMELLKKGNFAKGTLWRWLNGHTEPSATKIAKIASILEIEPEDLFRSPYEPIVSAEDNKHKKEVPVLGYAACGTPAEHWHENTNKFLDVGNVNGLVTPFILVAKGKSMFPMIYDKDLLLCTDIEFKQLKDEMLVVVSFKTIPDTADANAKLISLKKNYCTLYSINANYKPFDVSYSEIFKIYRVVKIIREVK